MPSFSPAGRSFILVSDRSLDDFDLDSAIAAREPHVSENIEHSTDVPQRRPLRSAAVESMFVSRNRQTARRS
jgi:hypothetical protein